MIRSIDHKLFGQAREGNLSRVQTLIRRGADPNVESEYGQTPLMVALYRGHFHVVKYLASHGALVDAIDPNETFYRGVATAEGTNLEEITMNPLLIIVANNGYYDGLRCLIECGADINIRDSTQETALMKAAKKNNVKAVKYLVENGADVDAINFKGETAIRMAAARGYQAVEAILTPRMTALQRTKQVRSAPDGSSPQYLALFEIELLEASFSDRGECRAKWLDADVVIKWFNPQTSQSCFGDEVQLWKRLRHPNIIKLYEACDVGDLQLFVHEFASGGSLIDYVKSNYADSDKMWRFLYEAALGLQYLHERNIIHGNLQCKNILIGSDGVAKLTSFSMSEIEKVKRKPTGFVGSMRWRAPELLDMSRMAPTFESDVYSLGMCILEAVTKEQPWGDAICDGDARNIKPVWFPEYSDEHEPKGLKGSTHDLVRRMCSNDPAKRISLAFIIDELKNMIPSNAVYPSDPDITFDSFEGGELRKLWESLQDPIAVISNSCPSHELIAQELSLIHIRLMSLVRTSPVVFQRFQEALQGFKNLLTTSPSQQRILQLSASSATETSIFAIERQISHLWRLIGEPRSVVEERKRRQRHRWVDFFMSDKSKTWFLLNDLQSHEERAAVLEFLKAEIQNNNGQDYSLDQLAILNKAYQDIARTNDEPEKGSSAIAPEWFIRWFELRMGEKLSVGNGGFGCAYKTEWLGSDVVVKELIFSPSAQANQRASHPYSTSSAIESVTSERQKETADDVREMRSEVFKMFQDEVDVWFNLRHPHVIELFGACHIGQPFFVCEYATNDTLHEYLEKYPKQIWNKLYEAALGVQYLHARGVVHGDLKGNNILIGKDEKAKVTDFGLSFTPSNGASRKITGAWHWLAPECMPEKEGNLGGAVSPTFESDVYALGMCIVEAMRVVDSIDDDKDAPYPWHDNGNVEVKVMAKRGMLPPRPKMCTDSQWELVKRMCCLDPNKRLVISTVVLDLSKLAAKSDSSFESQTELQQAPFEIPNVIKEWLTKLQDKKRSSSHRSDHYTAVCGILELVWRRLEVTHVKLNQLPGNADELNQFSVLVQDVRVETTHLIEMKTSTISGYTMTVLSALALHRQLDKFLDANFLNQPERGNANDAYRERCKRLLMGLDEEPVPNRP